MNKLEELDSWDFPDTHLEPDGYDMTSVVEVTPRNFELLMERHNELVRTVNEIANEMGSLPQQTGEE